jgi:hypothetical protein
MVRSKIQGIQGASIKEVRELSKLPWVRDDALSTRLSEARVLPDGRVLLWVAEGERGTIFPSRETLAETRREAAEEFAKGPVDLTRTLFPPIADFLRDVETHAANVGKVLHIPDEALDFTEASLDAVDAALKRVRPAARRMTPEVVTPLYAYVGEVMRRAAGGRWTAAPKTWTRRVPIYDPAEWAAAQVVAKAVQDSITEAGEKAKARGASPNAVMRARHEAHVASACKSTLLAPKPIGFKEVEVPLTGQENLPVLVGRDGRGLDVFRLVVVPMVEPSKRVQLRSGVDVMLRGYRVGAHAGSGAQGGPPGK